MVKKIDFIHYRKFSDENLFNFEKNINIISGTNGTCKTSLLHLISNSYQRVISNNNRFEKGHISLFNQLADGLNLKAEALTKGDQEYVDPARGTSGPLYSVSYYETDLPLKFRRHNSETNNNIYRFSLKPTYSTQGQSLPYKPVIYLGLSRLYPYGEFHSGSEKKDYTIPNKFKDIFQTIWNELYKQYNSSIRLEVSTDEDKTTIEKLSNIRNRASFKTSHEGVDSNTISSGQDSVYVILNALACLRFYYEGIKDKSNTKEIESILLIDEFDATLHPEVQFKLLDYIKQYSEDYHIQVIFTTHSLSLLEEALKDKSINVLYLLDESDSVRLIPNITNMQIRMFLKNRTSKDIFNDKKIPIYTEDAEARLFVTAIFDGYKKRNNDLKISKIIDSFYLVNANLGEDNLRSLFSDNFSSSLSKTAIAILDGDQTLQKSDQIRNIITLPVVDKSIAKNNTPERILIKFSFELFNNIEKKYDDFWQSDELMQSGFTKVLFQSNIMPEFESFIEFDDALNTTGESQKGQRREKAKKLFQDHSEFLQYVLRYWVIHEDNQSYIYKFLCNLNISFKRLAHLYDKQIADWDMDAKQ